MTYGDLTSSWMKLTARNMTMMLEHAILFSAAMSIMQQLEGILTLLVLMYWIWDSRNVSQVGKQVCDHTAP